MRIQEPLVKASIVFSLFLFSGFTHAKDPEAVPGEYLVKVKIPVHEKNLQDLGEQLNAKIKSTIPEHQIVVIQKSVLEESKSVIDRLVQNPLVEVAEPNYIFRATKSPNDTFYGRLWGLKNVGQSDEKNNGVPGIDIDAERAWDISTGSDDVIVAVIDTGIDYNHGDLKANMWVNEAEANGKAGVDDDKNGYIDDLHGINVFDAAKPTSNPMDDHGHGSHCAGVIGARGNDAKGIVGVNWNVKLMAVKFLGADGGGTMEGAIKAIDYATKMGAHIQSNSWGGVIEEATLLKEAVERSYKAGSLFVAAAGNDAYDIDRMDYYPATINVPSMVAVAAIDNQGRLAPFSNYGRKSVHVAAPGVNIYSAVAGGYDTWSGTSMATPHVAGVAALLLSSESGMKHTELKERMIETIKPLPALRTKVSSGGMVNAYFALTNQEAPPNMDDPIYWESKEISFSTSHPYGKKDNLEFEVNVDGAKEIALYFEKFDTERDYDKITLYDRTGKTIGTMSGSYDDSFSPVISGDYVKIKFTSDASVERYGFDLTKVSYR